MEIIAHRGVHNNPREENTVYAFARAVASDCPMIELDCRTAKDGKLIVNHDSGILFCGKHIPIDINNCADLVRENIVVNEIKDHRLDIYKPPTLDLVLKLFSHQIKINIELKDENSGEAFCKLLEKKKQSGEQIFLERLVVSSFTLGEVEKVKRRFPQLEAGLLRGGLRFRLQSPKFMLGFLKSFNFQAIHLDIERATKKNVKYFKDKGFKVRVYIVNDPKLLQGYINWGVDGIFTDKAPEFLKAQKELFLLPKYVRIKKNFWS